MRNGIEELLDIHIHDIQMPSTHLPVQLAQRAKAVPSGPKPMAVRRKIGLKDRLQYPKHRLLDHSVPDRRNPQRPLTPIRLGNQNPLDRERPISARPKLRDQFEKILFESLPKFFHADPNHSGCPMIGAHFFVGSPKPPKLEHLPHEAMKLPPLLHSTSYEAAFTDALQSPRPASFP